MNECLTLSCTACPCESMVPYCRGAAEAALKHECYLFRLLGHAKRVFSEGFDKHQAMRLTESTMLAVQLHSGQRRRTGEPYVAHVVRAALSAIQIGMRDVATIESIILHDLLEDCRGRIPNGDLGSFGIPEHVVEVVKTLTKDKCHHPIEYFEQVRMLPAARASKLCDRIDNLRTMYGAFSLRKVQEYVEESRLLLHACGGNGDSLGKYSDAVRELEIQIRYAMRSANDFILCQPGNHGIAPTLTDYRGDAP